MTIHVRDIVPDTTNAMDLSDTVTHVCPCGSRLFNLKVMFEDYEIGMYFTDMTCALCGTLCKAPTPLDNPDYLY